MNGKILLKAMKFSLLPTLLTFTLLFLGFMSFEKAFDFLTANDGWSIFVRISLFIAEICLIFYMYKRYEKTYLKELEIKEKEKKLENLPIKSEKSGKSIPHYCEVKEFFPSRTGYVEVLKTDNENYVLLKKND